MRTQANVTDDKCLFFIQIWDMNTNLEKMMKTYFLVLEILTSKKDGCMKTLST